MDDLLAQEAVAQAAAVRRGEVSAEALTRAWLDRVAARDGRLGAFVHVAPERALQAARRLDAARRPDRGPLWGVPTGIKDLHFTRGLPVRMGSRAWRWLWAPFDDLTSAAVRRAGMVIVGKLSTSELAFLPVVETDIGPPTRNPWDPTRTAGGSSGGSACAVAGGMLPVAPGSDGGGSIRIPAALCGLIGHKPTRGLVPNPHAAIENTGLSVVGPIARSVRDAAALLDVLVGQPRFLPGCTDAPARKRVQVSTSVSLVETHPRVEAAVRRVERLLSELGHEVRPGPVLDGDLSEFVPIYHYLAARTPVLFTRHLQPATRWLREGGRGMTRGQALAARDALSARVDGWLGGVDVWVTPTVAVEAPPIGDLAGLDGEAAFRRAAALGVFTAAINASGHPATTVPVWVDGAPVGVQLVGRRGEDAALLRLAHALLVALGTPVAPTAPRVDS